MYSYLKQGQSARAETANDIWSWGMSLLRYLDKDYTRAVAFNEAIFDDFSKKMVPETGPVSHASNAQAAFDSIRDNFSPIYDRRTWKLDTDADGKQISDGKVDRKWWFLLDNMLVRPDAKSTSRSCIHIDYTSPLY